MQALLATVGKSWSYRRNILNPGPLGWASLSLWLFGKIYLWLGDEQYLIKKTCLVFIPEGISY